MPRCREVPSVTIEFTDDEFAVLYAMLGEAIENVERYLIELHETEEVNIEDLEDTHSNYLVLYRRIERQHPLHEYLPSPKAVNLSGYEPGEIKNENP